MDDRWISLVAVILVGMVLQTSADCSWMGSGSVQRASSHGNHIASGEADGGDSVRVVSLSCADGTLKWRHAEGAMSVRFQPQASSALDGQRWQFCFRAFERNYGVAVYHQDHNNLEPLALDDSEETCVYADGGALTLFLDSNPKPDYHHGTPQKDDADSPSRPLVAAFYYSARPKLADDEKDSACRPCTEEELVAAYCSSEVVFQGLTTTATQTKTTKKKQTPADKTEPTSATSLQHITFVVEGVVRKPVDYSLVFERAERNTLKANVYMPLRCTDNGDEASAPKLPTTHLVMAAVELGRAKIRCAPLLSDFLTILDRLRRRSPCEIRTPTAS